MRDAGYEVDLEVTETDKRPFAVRFGKPGRPWVMVDHAGYWAALVTSRAEVHSLPAPDDFEMGRRASSDLHQ